MIRRLLFLTILTFFCAACSGGNSTSDSATTTVMKNMRELIKARREARKNPGASPPPRVYRMEDFAKLDQKIIRLRNAQTGYDGFFTPVSVNNWVTTYRSNGDQSVAIRGDHLRNTRGFAFDLLETAFSEDQNRIYRYLTPTFNLAALSVTCKLTQKGTERIQILDRSFTALLEEETCEGSGVTFVNKFWRSSSGAHLRSEQWLGPLSGTMVIETMN